MRGWSRDVGEKGHIGRGRGIGSGRGAADDLAALTAPSTAPIALSGPGIARAGRGGMFKNTSISAATPGFFRPAVDPSTNSGVGAGRGWHRQDVSGRVSAQKASPWVVWAAAPAGRTPGPAATFGTAGPAIREMAKFCGLRDGVALCILREIASRAPASGQNAGRAPADRRGPRQVLRAGGRDARH